MRGIPPWNPHGKTMAERSLQPSTRLAVAKLIAQVMGYVVYPLRLRDANPIPKGWAPKRGSDRTSGYVYPDEERQLMGCMGLPLCYRIFYGILAREGMRSTSEACALRWKSVDLQRGTLTLDKNKTGDARAWALLEGDRLALCAWFEIRGRPGPDAPVFVNEDGEALATVDESGEMPSHSHRNAELYRRHLRIAGITRQELFVPSAERMQIRAHDLRVAFVTTALANGRTETWVQDRAGHCDSSQINRYRRAARTAAELGLGDWTPLHEAIPELRARAPGILSGHATVGVAAKGPGTVENVVTPEPGPTVPGSAPCSVVAGPDRQRTGGDVGGEVSEVLAISLVTMRDNSVFFDNARRVYAETPGTAFRPRGTSRPAWCPGRGGSLGVGALVLILRPHPDRLDGTPRGRPGGGPATCYVCYLLDTDVDVELQPPQATGPAPGTGTTAVARAIDLRPLRMLLARIEAQLHPEQVWLFGSRGRGDARPDSDWDLFVVVPDDTRDEQLDLLFLWRLKRGSGVPADVIACRASEFREACDTVNTLSYAVATEGVRIDDR
jgi:integrase/predicted nucleotidyltransferase